LNDRRAAKKEIYSFGFTALEATRGCEDTRRCRHIIKLWFTAHAVASWYGRMAAMFQSSRAEIPRTGSTRGGKQGAKATYYYL